MYIEFPMSSEYRVRDLERITLEHELRKWSYQHNVDAAQFKLQYDRDRNVERVYVNNSRVLELFALSWNESIKPFVLRKG